MPRFYVNIADANRILDTGQECLTLEHAKKLAAQTAEELVRNKEPSRLRGKHVQVTAIWSTMCPSVVSSMECGSTGLKVASRLLDAGPQLQTNKALGGPTKSSLSSFDVLIIVICCVSVRQATIRRCQRSDPT